MENDMAENYGLTGGPAPELRVDEWLDGNDLPRRIADIDAPIIYLYAFQSWCPGCHSHGFPTLAAVKEHYEKAGKADLVEFIAIQTVFEGHETNTAEAALKSVKEHGLEDIALGHDSGHPPKTMADYRTGGTPWTVLIGPDREIIGQGFQADPTKVIEIIDEITGDTTNDSTTAPAEKADA